MADLLTHVLVAYAFGTVLGWYAGWFDRRWIAVAAVGAILPDLDRLDLLVPGEAIEATLGVPFDWGAVHTLGGLVLLAGAGSVPFGPRRRLRAFAVLVGGGLSHLALDGLKRYADGEAGTWLYPLTAWRHPTPGLYVSADDRLLAVAAALAFLAWILDRHRTRREGVS